MGGVTKIGPKGPIMPDGTAYELDVIIYATGFDALVGQFGGGAIKGRDKTMTMKENGYNACDPSQEEQEAWVAHCDKISENDVHSFCDSWYNGRNGAIKLEKGKTLPYVGSWGMYT